MKKLDLRQNEATVFRMLDFNDDRVLVINCTHSSMPAWVEKEKIEQYERTEETALPALPDFEMLSPEQKRIAHERFAIIAGILPFVGEQSMRSCLIGRLSQEQGISKQTLRRYLCRYLIRQSLSALVPQEKQQRPLTQDEKNMRWALNRFYYTCQKNSLKTAYTQMLRIKYCNTNGTLMDKYPSLHQFRYFYRKTKSIQTAIISREGIKRYQRDHRPLLGNGVQAFAPCIGVGMLDSTICDIYLVYEAGQLVGRPILTACVDACSSLCCGYSLSWEGGMYSLRSLLLNVIADKVQWCSRFGISIRQADWNCRELPATLVTDKGSEYKSANFEQIAELGVKVINLPSYRPELKGSVEKFFDLVQSLYKKQLIGKGVILPDFQERGSHDYRKDACLTMSDFEKIILRCILYYNNQRLLKDFPYTEEMLAKQIQPYASSIWEYGRMQPGAHLIPVQMEQLIYTLLPRIEGKFSRDGLRVNGLRYRNTDFTERYLAGGNAVVSYDPDDASRVWLWEQGRYTLFELIDRRFDDCALTDVQAFQKKQKAWVRRHSQKLLCDVEIRMITRWFCKPHQKMKKGSAKENAFQQIAANK